jgi:hypothetical protein
MNIGMLWFDNDPQTDLVSKVDRAATYYNKKYGKSPDLCFVHPSMVTQAKLKANGIEIRSSGQVLPHHFWIGLDKKGEVNGSR